MIIAIKSEMDSRVVLYPLMKACDVYGSVLVLTNNRFVRRVIDDDEFGTFKNITIVVDEEGSSDDIYAYYGILPNDYDYIIVDNMGISEYDRCLCLFGQKQSLAFMADKDTMEHSENVDNIVFLEFGKKSSAKPARPVKEQKPAEGVEGAAENTPAKKTGKVDKSVVPEDYNPADKFRNLVEEERKKTVVTYNVPFPSYDMIEDLEGMGKFSNIDEKLCTVFYDVMGKSLNIQFNVFRKEIKQVNESSSGNKSGRPSR